MSNSTCFAKQAPEEGPPLIRQGNIVFQAHHVGWIVTGFFTIVATVTSIWLVNKHLQWYTNKREQRYIVRLLFMVPLYAMISFASYLFWDHSTPLLLIRDCYESTVLTAFFYLLLTYISPSTDEQKAIFLKVGLSRQADKEARRKGKEPRKWMFPLRFIKKKPADGLYFLQMMKWGVLQYCVIRPTTTLAAVILNYIGWYCEESLSPRWGHVYITVVVSVSVSIAMYCLFQLYMPVSGLLAKHKPLLKLFAIKAVVFLTFWQATGLSVLSMFGVVKDTQYMTAADINIGLGAMLETFEMTLFAFLHIRAFSYKPYRPPYHPSLTDDPPPQRTPRLRSLGHAFDFRETFREISAGFIYILDRIRGVEPRPDMGARRIAMLENAFGRERLRPSEAEIQREKPIVAVEIKEEVDVDVGGERQWLGVGDNYAYGLGYASRREKSDGLGEAIAKELEKRGVTLRGSNVEQRYEHSDAGPAELPQGLSPRRSRRSSWWRDIYNRISQSGADPADDILTSNHRRKSRSRRISRGAEPTSLLFAYDDAPPPSIIHSYRNSLHSRESQDIGPNENLRHVSLHEAPSGQPVIHVQAASDILCPLPPSNSHCSPQPGNPDTSLVPLAPQVNRSDSLLGRVFPYGSPSTSSMEMSSAVASSQSTHDASAHPLIAHLQVKTNSAIVINPGEGSDRALLDSNLPLHIHISEDNSRNARNSSRAIGSASLSLPPPLPVSQGSLPVPTAPTKISLPLRRESAGRYTPHHSSSRQVSVPMAPVQPIRNSAHTRDRRTSGSFDPMNLYQTDQYAPGLPFAIDSLSEQSRYPTFHIPHEASPHSRSGSVYGSPSYKPLQQHQQGLLFESRPGLPLPDLQSLHHGSSRNSRNRHSTPAPVDSIRPHPSQHTNGYLSRHSAGSTNSRQFNVPALLTSPPPTNPLTRYSRPDRHPNYLRRSSELSNLPEDPSQRFQALSQITNALPSQGVRQHRTRYDT